MTIDGRKVAYDEKAKSVLEVARSSGTQIPTLCDHSELEPYGGCRMCLVEIEGLRGYVASCTTPPKDGMVVTTHSDELIKMKRNILQLVLREHPSACIVCYEWPGCLKYRTEMHRAGAVTGCNTCPNRESCELREVAELLDIRELEYQPSYKTIPIERNDPFFDRDYNLCILCGRCVRVCDEVRGTSAITFAERGHVTRVNTAFGSSHLDSGCWFCGACVDVCPTGALSPRMTKWIGTPDESTETTCVLCGVGCQTKLDIKWGRVMGSGPGRKENGPNNGHMCVLGRFCIPSLVNAPDRLKTPLVKQDGTDVPVTWEDALTEVSRVLKETDPKRIGFLGSPHMSSESAYLFHKIARVGVKSANVDFQGSDFAFFITNEIEVGSKTLDDLDDFDWIMSIGGDFVKTHQVVAKRVYDVVKKGKPLIVVGEVGLNLKRWAEEYIPIPAKKIPSLIEKLSAHDTKITGLNAAQAQRLVELTKKGKGAILIGPRVLEVQDPSGLLRALVMLAGKNGVQFPMFPLGNEAGVIKAGLRPEMLPGPSSVSMKDSKSIIEREWGGGNTSDGLHLVEMREKARRGEIDVLYVADGSISMNGFEKVPTIIYQSPFPSEWEKLASVTLPSVTFAEENGTFVNLEMTPLKLKSVGKPPGLAKEDWQIFMELGKRISAKGFDYKGPEQVWEELSRFTHNIKIGGMKTRLSWKPASKEKNDWYPRYRGATLAERIQDLATLIDSLPKRDRPISDESLDKLIKRLERQREKEVSR
ncbi:MAG: molybdopterin-dependent oxidoreductase [Promethearchaeota archaeon]